jgi:hypothetical protein
VDLTLPSVLNLNIENLCTPAAIQTELDRIPYHWIELHL